jgi:hypothetical protein
MVVAESCRQTETPHVFLRGVSVAYSLPAPPPPVKWLYEVMQGTELCSRVSARPRKVPTPIPTGPEHEPVAPPEGGEVLVDIEPACPSDTNAAPGATPPQK